MTKRNFWVGTCAAMLAVSLSVGIGVTVHNAPVAAEAVTTVEGVWKYVDEGTNYYVAVKEETGQDKSGNATVGYCLFYTDMDGTYVTFGFDHLYAQGTDNKYATLPAAQAATAFNVKELEYQDDGSISFTMYVENDQGSDKDQSLSGTFAKETVEAAAFSGKWSYEDDDDGTVGYNYSFDLDAMIGTYNSGAGDESFDTHFVMGNVAAFFMKDDIEENCVVYKADSDYFFSNSFGGYDQLTAVSGGGDTGDTGETATSVEGKWTFAENDMFAWVDLVEEQEYNGVYVVIVFDGGEPYSVMFGFLTQDAEDQSIYTDETSMYQLGFQLNEANRLSISMYGEPYYESTAYTALPTESSLSGKMGGLDYAGATLVIDFTDKSVESDTYTFSSSISSITVGDVPVFYENGEEETTYVVCVSSNGKVYAVVYADMDYDLVELGEYKDQLTVTYAKGTGADDATVPAAVTVEFGGYTALPGEETAYRSGYKLLGWTCPDYMDGDRLDPEDYIVVVKDLTFTAVWILDVKYTVSFSAGDDVTGATVPDSVQVQNGELLDEESLSPEPSRDGYAFSHWEKNGVEYDFSDPVTEDFTLTAVWDAVVTYYFKGNFTATGYSFIEDEETSTFTRLSFTLTGDKISNLKYTLAGEAAAEADYLETATTSFTLTEKWAEADLYFRFGIGSPTYYYYFFVNADRTKVVFTNNYATLQDGAEANAFVTDPNSGKFTVTFDSNGGSSVNAINDVESGSTITAPTAPTKEGYTFVGWYKDTDCTEVFDFENDTVVNDVTLHAKWEVNKYTVHFNSHEGSAVADKTNVEYNTTITAPTAPTREGYTFDGWFKDDACTQAFDFENDKITGETTLHAKWTAVSTETPGDSGSTDNGTTDNNSGSTDDNTTDNETLNDLFGCGSAIAAPVATLFAAVLMVGVVLVIRKKHSEK